MSVGQEKNEAKTDSVMVSVWTVNDCIENGLLVKIQEKQIREMNRNAEKDDKDIQKWKLISKIEAGALAVLFILLAVRR